MSKGPRTDVLALAGLGAAAAIGIGLLILRSMGGGRTRSRRFRPTRSSVASIDVASLAQSPLGEVIVRELRGDSGARAGTLLGVDSIAATCGFDPLPLLRAIAVAIPEGGERGDFGVAASGVFTKDALAACAKAVIAKRGGEASTRQAGSFTVVSDARSGGCGDGVPRRGSLPRRARHVAHADDRRGGRADPLDSRPPAARGTRRLRVELATRDPGRRGDRRDGDPPTRPSRPPPARDGPRVASERERWNSGNSGNSGHGERRPRRWKGSSASPRPRSLSTPAARTRTRASSPSSAATARAACGVVSTLILHTRLIWSGNLGYRLFGLGPLIDNLEVRRARATSLFVQTHAPADDLAKMVERAAPVAAEESKAELAARQRAGPSHCGAGGRALPEGARQPGSPVAQEPPVDFLASKG